MVAVHSTAKNIIMVAEHGTCKAMYIPVIAELCTKVLYRMMVNRRTRYISKNTVHFTIIYNDLLQEFPIIMKHHQYIHDLPVAVHCSVKYIMYTETGCSVQRSLAMIHRNFLWIIAYDRWTLHTVSVYIDDTPQNADCALFSDVQSFNRGALHGIFIYIDGTPQDVVQCSAKYIPMTTDRCTHCAANHWWFSQVHM